MKRKVLTVGLTIYLFIICLSGLPSHLYAWAGSTYDPGFRILLYFAVNIAIIVLLPVLCGCVFLIDKFWEPIIETIASLVMMINGVTTLATGKKLHDPKPALISRVGGALVLLGGGFLLIGLSQTVPQWIGQIPQAPPPGPVQEKVIVAQKARSAQSTSAAKRAKRYSSSSLPPKIEHTDSSFTHAHEGFIDPKVDGESESGGPVRIERKFYEPVPLFHPEAQYSELARNARVQGKVLLNVVIDEEGNTRDVRVLRGLGFGLDEKAIETILTWKFKPALANGRPVKVSRGVECDFRLFKTSSLR